MKHLIVVPTRDRIEMCRKTIPLLVEQDLPVLLVTEKDEVMNYSILLREIGLTPGLEVAVIGLPLKNQGHGYSRAWITEVAREWGYTSLLFVDDDSKINKGYNCRPMLEFVEAKKGMVCAGWHSNYGIWIKGGNAVAKEPNLVVPRPQGHDHVYAVNIDLVLKAGNFERRLYSHVNAELNRSGIASGYLWFVHTGVHISCLNKPGDPGGIATQLGEGWKKRPEVVDRTHEIILNNWGPKYISPMGKRITTKWQLLATDYIGPKAALALKEAAPFDEAEVTAEMFRG